MNNKAEYTPEKVVDISNLSREDWLEYRKKGIGGSDVAAIMGISPFATIRDLFYNKTGVQPVIQEEEESNWVAKEVGHRLEDLVAEIFSKKTGLEVFPVRVMFRHPLYPFMLADVDFFVRMPDGTFAILECKTCNYNAKDKWADEGIPAHYVLQVRHYLSVMNMQKAFIACLYGNNENEFVYRTIERDLIEEEDMVESTGCENASTMHLALGLLGDDTDFEPDFEYLSAGFLNVDEVSMVDMHLAYEFFRRVSRHARVLLVGDKNQLPSVGAGDVFRQLIACGLIPVTVLDLVYRQGALSSIPYNAKLMQENKTNLSFGEDFQFIACKGADEAAEIVRRIYLDEIAKNGMDQVQILTPYRKRSAAGVDELNKSLEDFVNPPIAGKKELHIGSQVFRVGDKILQNKNTEMASNGDLGRILDCITDEDGNARAVIGFPDGRQVQYEADQMEMIEHANATTIHKAQGSECPVVIIPWVKAFYMMLKRNILYTGVTRAKSKVYLVGEWAAVCQAIHTDDSGTRNTILSERIVQYYDQYQSEQKPEMEQLKLVV